MSIVKQTLIIKETFTCYIIKEWKMSLLETLLSPKKFEENLHLTMPEMSMGDPYEPISVFDSYENRVFNYKWKFLMFQTVYRLVISQKISNKISSIMFYINLFIYLIPSLYLFGKTVGRNNLLEDPPNDVFPYSQMFSLITPWMISATSFSFLVFSVTLASLIAAIYCYFAPVKISNFFWMLNPEVHTILMPIICGTAAYAFSIIIDSSISYTPFKIFCWIFFVEIIFYFLLYICMVFVLEVSIMRPHPQFTKYFSPFYWWVPFFRIFSSLIYYLIGRIDSPHVCMILLIIIAVIIVLLIFNFWYFQPFCTATSTESQIAQLFLLLVNTLCLIFYKYEYFENTGIIYGFQPILAIVFTQISIWICSARKNHFIRYLINISPGQYLSNEYLEDIFRHFKTSTEFYLLTIFGIQTNCYVVSTQEYVGYLISKFPTKEWVLRYTIEMYSTVWGVDNDTYRYFLHLLSSNAHSFPTQTMLFESVYCYMQSAYHTSPIISNTMSSFTEMIILFAQMTKNLWSHAPDSADGLYYDMRYCHEALESCANKIKELKVLYPFSPEVHFMNCIFLADCQKNFEKASDSYHEGTLYLLNREKAITKVINSWHTMNSKIKDEIETVKEENKGVDKVYSFLSVCSQLSGFVRRKVNMLLPNQFLKLFSNSYTAERNQLLPEFQLITKWFRRLYAVLIIFVIVQIAFTLHLFSIFHQVESIADEYDYITDFNAYSRNFLIAASDLYFSTLIFPYANEDFPDSTSEDVSGDQYHRQEEGYLFYDQTSFLTTFSAARRTENFLKTKSKRNKLTEEKKQGKHPTDFSKMPNLTYDQKDKLFSLINFVQKSRNQKNFSDHIPRIQRTTLDDSNRTDETKVQDFIIFHMNEILPDLTNYTAYRDEILRYYSKIINFTESNNYFESFELFERSVLITIQNYTKFVLDNNQLQFGIQKSEAVEAALLMNQLMIDYANSTMRERYYQIWDRLEIDMIIIACVVVVVVAIIIFFSQRMKHDVWIIFKTIQYNVRKMLEQQFNTLLKGKEVDITPIPPASTSAPYILAIVSVIIFELQYLSILILCQQCDTTLQTYDLIDVSYFRYLTVNLEIYYQHIQREHTFCATLGFEECHETLPSEYCTHSYFTQNYEVDKGPFIDQFHSQSLLNILMLLVSVIFLFFLIITIRMILHSFRVYKESSYLLFSIPISLGRSNYLFNIILTGGLLEKRKAENYAKEVSELSYDYQEFGTIDFDPETEQTIKTVGNINGIMGCIPDSIEDLKNRLLADGGSQTVITKMFQNKGSKMIIMAKHADKEYMAVFLSPTKIFIRDESNDQIANRGDVIDFMYLKYSRKQINEIVNGGIVLFFSEEDEEISQLFEAGKKYEHVFNVDARYKMLHYALNFDEDPVETAAETISFLKEGKKILKHGGCVASYGGKLTINSANKQMIEKSRIVGKPLQVAIIAALSTNDDAFLCQKEIFEAANKDFQNLRTEQIKISDTEEYTFMYL